MIGLDNPIHIAFLFFVVLLVFGAKRLPEIGRSLGAGMRGFKDSLTGMSAEPPAAASRHELPTQTTSASVAAPPLSPVPPLSPAPPPAAAPAPATLAAPCATTAAEPSQQGGPPSAA